jgi:hypothetical protein
MLAESVGGVALASGAASPGASPRARVKARRAQAHCDNDAYIVEAENRGATFGEPFPVLPRSLTGEPPKGAGGSAKVRAKRDNANAIR